MIEINDKQRLSAALLALGEERVLGLGQSILRARKGNTDVAVDGDWPDVPAVLGAAIGAAAAREAYESGQLSHVILNMEATPTDVAQVAADEIRLTDFVAASIRYLQLRIGPQCGAATYQRMAELSYQHFVAPLVVDELCGRR